MSEFKITTEFKKTLPWKLVVIFLCFSVAIILVGISFYKSQRRRIITEYQNDLSAIASLKIGQIQQWQRERLGDAATIRDNEPLISSIKQYIRDKNKPELKAELIKWMKSLCIEYDYSSVLFIDTSLKVRLNLLSADTVAGEIIGKDLSDVLENHKIIMTDIHKSESVGYAHIDLLVPLVDPESKNESLTGILILRIDPSKLLFPLVQSWPTPSKSSETLIVRKDGDSVLYLNELRHIRNTSLKLKAPLSNKNLLGAKAVSGFKGVTEGVDYRNMVVVGYLDDIPGFPWFMISKVDKAEILLPIKKYLILIVIVIILLVLINASIFGFWIWDLQVRFYRKQLKNEEEIKESEEKFITAFQMSPVSVTISSMNDNKFIDINKTFLNDMGYTREEVIGRTARELDIWADENERLWLINEISEKGKIFGKVISYKTRAGKIIYGLSSMSVVKVNGESCNLSTVVNVTDTITTEKKLAEQYFTLKGITESSRGPIFSLDKSFCYTSFNKVHSNVMKFLYGVDIEIGKNMLNYQTTDHDRIRAKANLDRALSGEYVEESSWSGEDVNNRRFFEVTHNPIFNDVNIVIGVAVNARDLTERKKIEEKLLESEELFRSLFENMLNGFAYCKMICEDGKPPDFLYLKVNKAFTDLTGLRNVTGKKASEAIPGIQEADPDLLERYNRVAFTGVPEVFEIYVESLKMWFAISVYCPQKGYFVAVFDVITARKLAEEKLQESRATLKSIIDNSNSLIYLVDTEGRFVMVNKHLQTLLSLSGELLIGETREVFLPKEIADLHRKNDLAVIKSGKTQVFEEENIEPDGKHIYLTTKFPLFNDRNEIFCVGGLSTDITERKLAENELHESEKRLREAQEMAHLGFWLWDIKTGNVEWSEEVYKIFCLDPETFIPQIDSILELSPWPEDNQRGKELINRAIESHEPGTYEQKFLRPDKSIGYYNSTFRGSYDNNGDLVSIVGTILDITERILAEEALRESEDKFKYVFDHSVAGKSITFPSGEIHVNKAFCEMTGYSPEELTNTKWQNISYPDDIKITEDELQSLISGEKKSTRFIKRYIHKNGKIVWADVGTALRRDINGKPLYFMTTAIDITERKLYEETIHTLNEELELKVKQRTELLEAANKELEAFSYSVSHDLRAPLRSVHGFTKILIEDYESKLDDEGKRICGIISSSATQMGELIDDLLSFSRIGRSTLNLSLIDMKKMVHVIFETMTSPVERVRIKLNVGKMTKAFGDVPLVGQVWTNLISNAIKYSSKNDISEINMGSETEGKMVTYYIKDNGVGFDMQYAHKLFGVFQRLHSESEFEGNGVGLAIVQRIVLKHGGKVWAEGEVGKGATFFFSLPVPDKNIMIHDSRLTTNG